MRNAVLTEVLFCEGENQLILFSPKPPRCGRNIVLPVLLLCRRCIFHMNKPGHKLNICPYFHLQTFNKLILYTFCTITAALRNWISLVKVSYQGNFHGRFLTIIFATFSKSGSQIVFTCISCSLPWWRPHRKHFSTKKCKKCTRSNNLTPPTSSLSQESNQFCITVLIA